MNFDTPLNYARLQAGPAVKDIPAREDCRSLWQKFLVTDEVVAHSETVAELARILGIFLKRAGLNLDIDLIVSAGLLHGLAEGMSDGASAGADLLPQLGYPRVAEVVSPRKGKSSNGSRPVDEADLICLAHQYVTKDRPIPLEKQYSAAADRFSSQPAILHAISRRLNEAQAIRERMEGVLGCSVDQIIHKYRRGLQAASVSGPRNIYLVRHGAICEEESDGRYTGQLDAPLSPDGIRRAQELSRELSGVRFAAIYCSDLGRSVETARIIAGPHHLQPSERRDLREIDFGRWEGLTPDQAAGLYPRQFEERSLDLLSFRPPDGESYMDCSLRVIPAFYEMLHANRGNLLIVGHAHINRIILCQAMGVSLDRLFEFGQDYGCLNVIGVGDSGFAMKTLNRGPGPDKGIQ